MVFFFGRSSRIESKVKDVCSLCSKMNDQVESRGLVGMALRCRATETLLSEFWGSSYFQGEAKDGGQSETRE